MKGPHEPVRRKRVKPCAHPTAHLPVPGGAKCDAAPAAAYAPVLKAGVKATVQTVQDIHHSISDKTFASLQYVPGLAVSARVVQGVHDTITHGVYAAVRHGSGALISAAGVVEELTTDASRSPSGRERAMRSALNGVFGDALAQAGSSLSMTMGFHRDGSPLPMTSEALAGLRPRVCVFIHGLACDEQSWQRAPDAWMGTPWEHALAPGEPVHYGALLAKEFDVSAIYLRYNTGLPIAENARQLADQLEQLAAAAPSHVNELVLIGHSMGGLVARGACEVAAASSLSWPSRVRLMVCLGTPHHGAPLEKLGHLTSLALNASKVTQPLGRMANTRSQGIKDLRHGLKPRGGGKTPVPPPSVALRLIAASLGDRSEGVMGSLIGRTLGDGLVLPPSAVADGQMGDVQRVELAGLGHMGLLNHPRVYAQLRQWLIDPGSAESPGSG